jgi:hypothetical protein
VVAAPAGAETLRELLAARGQRAEAKAIRHLDRPVTGVGVFEDERSLLVAYYLDDGSGRLVPPLRVSRLDKRARAWKTVEVSGTAAGPETVECAGSVTEIHAGRDHVYLDVHLNPLAGCLLVLSRDLTVRVALRGWFLGAFRDGTIVYHRSQVHFASTHSAEIALYDVRRRQDRTILPMSPHQAVRQAHIDQLRPVYADAAWCAAHNHACDPERFDSRLVGRPALDDAGRALAFVVAFDNTVFWTEAERWRLEGFRGLRRELERGAVGPTPREALFRYLAADLGRVRNLGAEATVAGLFDEDPELRALLEGALAATPRPGESGRAFLEAVDPRWTRPEPWRRLAEAIRVPPEATLVAYVYRNVGGGGAIEYRELRLDEVRARTGQADPARWLEPPALRRIFRD